MRVWLRSIVEGFSVSFVFCLKGQPFNMKLSDSWLEFLHSDWLIEKAKDKDAIVNCPLSGRRKQRIIVLLWNGLKAKDPNLIWVFFNVSECLLLNVQLVEKALHRLRYEFDSLVLWNRGIRVCKVKYGFWIMIKMLLCSNTDKHSSKIFACSSWWWGTKPKQKPETIRTTKNIGQNVWSPKLETLETQN